MTVPVLAFDLATRVGWAGDGAEICPPRTGTYTLHTKGTIRGPAFLRFDEWAYDLIGTLKPKLIAYEAPVITGRPTGLHEALLLIGLAAHVEAMAAAHGVPVVDPPPHVQTIRKQTLGHGRPTNAKKAVMDFCAMLGWNVHGDDNRADAALLWMYVKSTRDRSFRVETGSPLFAKVAAARSVA